MSTFRILKLNEKRKIQLLFLCIKIIFAFLRNLNLIIRSNTCTNPVAHRLQPEILKVKISSSSLLRIIRCGIRI